jgi:DNA replication and repair protein RecF
VSFLSQLKLNNFRNYSSRNFNFTSKITAISGQNGVGKTNILEAISLLNKGSGLKGAEFSEMVNFSALQKESIHHNFSIYGQIESHPQIDNVGTSYLTSTNKRIFQVNHDESSRPKKLPAIIWLTPQMDNLFYSSKSDRRKFLDKIVCDINPSHNSIINAYNHEIRERINLLQTFANQNSDQNDNWLKIIERKIAELGIAIATARNEAIEYLNQSILQGSDNFTKARIEIIGEAEELARNNKSLMAEEKFIQRLQENRKLDAKSNRTHFGIHRSDFTAILLGDKQIYAKSCSTGEQKSILIALTFARIRLFSMLNLPIAILLLDEIVSHLDMERRKNLLQEITKLDCQSFLTAISKDFYQDLSHFDGKMVSFLELN